MWNAKVNVIPGPWPKVSVSLERDGRKAIEIVVDPSATTAAHESTIAGFLWLFAGSVRKDYKRALEEVRAGAGRMRTVGDAIEHVDDVKRQALRIVDEELARARLDIAGRKAELLELDKAAAVRRVDKALAANPDVKAAVAAAPPFLAQPPAQTNTTEKAPHDGGTT